MFHRFQGGVFLVWFFIFGLFFSVVVFGWGVFFRFGVVSDLWDHVV